MQWVKVPLILAALALLVVVFRRRRRVGFRAGTRMLALLLAAAAVVSIAVPDIPQRVADWLGVARGTDLLLYLLVVVFAVTTLGLYLRLQESDVRYRQLTRAVALMEARRAALNPTPPSARAGAAGPAGASGAGANRTDLADTDQQTLTEDPAGG